MQVLFARTNIKIKWNTIILEFKKVFEEQTKYITNL